MTSYSIAVEYAHANLAAIDSTEIARSAEAAAAVTRFLVDKGHHVHTQVLLDDKKLDRSEAERRTLHLMDLLGALDARPASLYYERDLMEHLDAFAELLPDRQRRALERSTRNSMRKYESLPCSVDIALWHSLRLGVIGHPDAIEPTDLAVSVLGDSTEEQELKARQDLLNHVHTATITSRVIDLYYPERASARFDPQILVQQLADRLKEYTPCPAS